MFKKILIANRAEIALRVIRTCQEMGIATVAIHSDADKDCLHVKLADEAVNIGPPVARKSYLNADAIIQAAKDTHSEAIHPGYGFLAENASFVELCTNNGIKFIGPSAETQHLTGAKIESRVTAEKAGVPLSPGSNGAVTPDEAVKIAQEIGYPIIIKASYGGGGRGMRVVNNEEELRKFLPIAMGEAQAGFGNSAVFVEKYIEEPRHIEFQILADESGNVVHLGERECSIQKRYQKLIEESPSSLMDDELRQKMGDAAIKVARSVGYVNAGTVEFLVDSKRNFYFNEVNSRLQVEHPVTEMVTGIDLVRQQILIAAGNKLEFTQDEIQHKGWSIECRINAEDPDNNFATAPGTIKELLLPGGFGVRVDTHLYTNYQIPPFYDSLVAKLIVWGEDREIAINRMARALNEFHVDGLKSTIPFHQRVMQNHDFVSGHFNTHFVKNLMPEVS
jgi:acetyl-CoA carboxylase biotin carboxylase subunit